MTSSSVLDAVGAPSENVRSSNFVQQLMYQSTLERHLSVLFSFVQTETYRLIRQQRRYYLRKNAKMLMSSYRSRDSEVAMSWLQLMAPARSVRSKCPWLITRCAIQCQSHTAGALSRHANRSNTTRCTAENYSLHQLTRPFLPNSLRQVRLSGTSGYLANHTTK